MTAHPYLSDNLEWLAMNSVPVAKWMAEAKVDGDELENRVIRNKWNLMDWKLDSGQGMFESLPPSPLYSDWTPTDKAPTSASIIIGCNLGYGLNHVLTQTPDSHKVILLEPDPMMLMACLGQTDYRPFFENRKLHIMLPDEDYLAQVVQNLDLQFVYGRIFLRQDVPSQQLGPDYASWAMRAKNRLENFTVEFNTLRFRQDLMVGNELKNFKRSLTDGSLAPLQGLARGLSAVMLGAGPSLEMHALKLREKPGDALYVTALQAMPALQRLGLKPDFCLGIDFNEAMLKVYDRLDPEWAADVPLIYSTKMNPDVVKSYPGPTIPLWTMGGMATFVLRDNELVLDAGGNVSLTLIRFLRWCGVSQVLLAGLDFAWRDRETHVKGHHTADKKISYKPHKHLKMKNLDGEEIITSLQYMTSKRELEADVAKDPIRIFNLYGGGAPIKGARAIDFDQAHMMGVLASEPGSVSRFRAGLMQARVQERTFSFEPQSHFWAVQIRKAEKRLEKLFKKTARNQNEIHQTMEHVMAFIKHDPLYLPYLFNETIDMAGLTKAKYRFEPRDFSEFKKIGHSIMKKVKEVDRRLSAA